MHNSKIKILIYTVVFLTVLNIAAIGTILYNISKTKNLQQAPANIPTHPTAPIKPPNNQPIRFHRPPKLRRIIQQLNLSPEQEQKFMNIHRRYLQKIRPILRQIRQTNDSIGFILLQNPQNFEKIKALAHHKAVLIEKLTLLQAQEFIELSKICTPQQRKILFQIYSRRYNHRTKREKRNYPGH